MTGRVSSVLVGRSEEFAALCDLLAEAQDSRGRAVAVSGPAGIGKSRLLAELSAEAVSRGFAVVRGQARVDSRTSPFALTLDALGTRARPGTPDHDSSFRSLLEAGAPGAAGFLLTERLLETLDALATTPTVLVLEDVHWADNASQRWLVRVIDRAATLPLAVVLTTRTLGSTPALVDVARSGGLVELAIGALSADEVVALTTNSLGRSPGPRLRTALGVAAGNPFAVLAMLEGLDAVGALTVGPTSIEVAGDGVPIGPSDSITARLHQLPDKQRRIVQVGAVLGIAPAVATLTSMVGGRTVEVVEALEAAVHAGLMESAPGGYRFPHQLYVDAVVALWPEDARRAFHHDAARALAETGAPAAVVAGHLARSARHGDPYTIEWLERAAGETVTLEPDAALQVLDVALELAGRSAPLSLQVLRLQALAATGRTGEAERLGRSLLDRPLPAGAEAVLHRELALTYFLSGDAVSCGREMEAAMALTTDPVRHTRLRAELSFAHFLALDHQRARAEAETACRDAAAVGDVVADVAARTVRCWLDLLQADLASAVVLADEAERLADRPDAGSAHVYQPWFTAALARLEADDFAGSARSVQGGRAVAQRVGAAWAIAGYDGLSAFAAMREGRLDDAAAIARQVVAMDQGVDGIGVQVWCHGFLGQIALHRGDHEAADRHAVAASAQLASGRAQVGMEQLALVEARRCELAGEHGAALHHLAPVWDLFGDLDIVTGRQQIGAEVVRLAVLAGDHGRAADVTGALQETARRTGLASWLADADRALAWLRLDPDQAHRAAERYGAAGRRLARAAALTDVADLAARLDRTAVARAAARTAAAFWTDLGAPADAQRVANAHDVRTPTPRPRLGVRALTPTERRVVELIATGRSNQAIAEELFVSRRTVESHVSAAYRKLGVRSRVSLARIALDLDETAI
jgi:DNA-binding CsgD family transcriptional regulator